MKVPGKAWLQFEVIPQENGNSQLSQTAYFAPQRYIWVIILVYFIPPAWIDLIGFDQGAEKIGGVRIKTI
jgi:hypothetical protein